MERQRINQILMRMGGSQCRKSHLTKNGLCNDEELHELVQCGYLAEQDNGEYLRKTEKGSKTW